MLYLKTDLKRATPQHRMRPLLTTSRVSTWVVYQTRGHLHMPYSNTLMHLRRAKREAVADGAQVGWAANHVVVVWQAQRHRVHLRVQGTLLTAATAPVCQQRGDLQNTGCFRPLHVSCHMSRPPQTPSSPAFPNKHLSS